MSKHSNKTRVNTSQTHKIQLTLSLTHEMTNLFATLTNTVGNAKNIPNQNKENKERPPYSTKAEIKPYNAKIPDKMELLFFPFLQIQMI